jgi:uncharacterized protein YicC (UPF0701 family)
MVKKILPNRSSKTVKPDAEAKLQQAVTIFLELLGEETAISEAEYAALYKISDKRKQECDQLFGLMQANPNLVKKPLSIVETTKDKTYYEFVAERIQTALKSLKTRADREQTIAGSEYVNSCKVWEADVNADAHRDNAHAQTVQAELKKVKRYRPTGVSKKKVS